MVQYGVAYHPHPNGGRVFATFLFSRHKIDYKRFIMRIHSKSVKRPLKAARVPKARSGYGTDIN